MSFRDLGSGVSIVNGAYGLRIAVDGQEVPHLMVMRTRIEGEECEPTDRICILVDGRLGFDVPRDGAAAWIRLMANAMAVSAGVTCFGVNAQDARLAAFGPTAPSPVPSTLSAAH